MIFDHDLITFFASRDHEIIDRSYLCQSHPWIFQGCTDLHKCSMASVFRVLATIAMTAVTSEGGWKKLTKLLCTTATTFPFCDCTCERHPPPLHLAINCVVFDTDIKARLVLPSTASSIHTYIHVDCRHREGGGCQSLSLLSCWQYHFLSFLKYVPMQYVYVTNPLFFYHINMYVLKKV